MFLMYNDKKGVTMIIIFGMAGSGKSTQGDRLAEKFGMRWLSVGQVLRETGKFDEILKNGKLVDDEVVIELMNKQIAKCEMEGFNVILDGYPRDDVQARYVADNMADKIEGAIILNVPEEELWKRIQLRGREDDTREVLKRRFEVFEQNIYTILELLKNKGVKVENVDGTGTMDEVEARLTEVVKKLIPSVSEQANDVNGEEIEKSYGE